MKREERERLIKHLEYNRSIGADYLITDKDADEIIKALKAKPCADCVSRELVIDYLLSEWNHELKDIVKGIRALPPVTPAPKMGRWIATEDGFECSECGCISRSRANFCQYCGAKMEVDE